MSSAPQMRPMPSTSVWIDRVFQTGHLLQEEMFQGDVGITHPHEGVQVGAPQVAVYEDHLFSQAGQADSQSQGDDALADAALAAADAQSLILFSSADMLPSHGKMVSGEASFAR